MSDHDPFLGDDDESGHLAEDVGLTDEQFQEVADLGDRRREVGSEPSVAPPD